MKSERPWGWRLFIVLDLVALVIGPGVLFATQVAILRERGVPGWAVAQVLRLIVFGVVALLALGALAARCPWGRWLLLAVATLKYGVDIGIVGLMLKAGAIKWSAAVYPLVRALVLLGVHWVYLSHPRVRCYVERSEC